MPMPDNATPQKSRAALIRELVAAGLDNKAIRAKCVEAGFDAPPHKSLYSARNYQPKGRPPPVRPSYYSLCLWFLEERERARARGIPLALTPKMIDLLSVMELNIIQDIRRVPLTKRRYPKKRKPKKKAQA